MGKNRYQNKNKIEVNQAPTVADSSQTSEPNDASGKTPIAKESTLPVPMVKDFVLPVARPGKVIIGHAEDSFDTNFVVVQPKEMLNQKPRLTPAIQKWVDGQLKIQAEQMDENHNVKLAELNQKLEKENELKQQLFLSIKRQAETLENVQRVNNEIEVEFESTKKTLEENNGEVKKELKAVEIKVSEYVAVNAKLKKKNGDLKKRNLKLNKDNADLLEKVLDQGATIEAQDTKGREILNEIAKLKLKMNGQQADMESADDKRLKAKCDFCKLCEGLAKEISDSLAKFEEATNKKE